MRIIGPVLLIIGALIVIVGVALGAHIYRWEMIVWPAIAIAWALVALAYRRDAQR